MMNNELLAFAKINVNHNLLNEVWGLNPKELDSVDGVTLSSYALALSQYLVYFTYQKNLMKAEQHKLNKYIERSISLILTEDKKYLKEFKTKSAAADHIITSNMDLIDAQSKLENLQIEAIQIDGIDKTIGDLIATIKRELTRRENELYQIRMERRN